MLKKYFTILMIILPILNSYNIGIAGIGIGDGCLLLLYPALTIHSFKKNIKIMWPLLPWVSYIFLHIVFFLFTDIDDLELYKMLTAGFKYILYILTIVLFNRSFYEVSYGIYFLEKFTMILIGIACIQWILFEIFGYVLPGLIDSPLLESREPYELMIAAENLGVYRPMSLFLEPSYFCTYLIPILILSLFGKSFARKSRLISFVVSFGIIISRSSTGIFFLIGLLLVFIFFSLKNYFNKICFFLMFLGAILLFLNSSYGEFFIQRTFSFQSGNLMGEATQNRLINYYVYLRYIDDDFTQLFGSGYGIGKMNILNGMTLFTPGFLSAYLYHGLIGVFLIISILLWLVFRSNTLDSKLIFLCFLVLGIATPVLYRFTIMFYFVLAMKNESHVVANAEDKNILYVPHGISER